MKRFYASWFTFLTRFIYLQLFLTLISLPIIISWGLPISLLSFAGNLFFSPILTLFLLLSSLLFFCHLLAIPCGPISYTLDCITQVWLWIMRKVHGHCFIAFHHTHFLILAVLIVAVLAVIHAKKIIRPWIGGSLLLTIFIVFYSICACWTTPETVHHSIACAHGNVSIIKEHKEILVSDDKSFGGHVSLESWLEYTLMPEIIKQTGATHIDHLIVSSSNARTFTALKNTLQRFCIRNLYLPGWQGRIPNHHYRTYRELKREAERQKCNLFFIHKKKRIVNNWYQLTPTGYRNKDKYKLAQFKLCPFKNKK